MARALTLKIHKKVADDDDIPYACETVDKTAEEWNGGTPVRYGGRKKLLEASQVPPSHTRDYSRIRYFHANNLWVSLCQLKEVLDSCALATDVTKSHKVFDGKPVHAACVRLGVCHPVLPRTPSR